MHRWKQRPTNESPHCPDVEDHHHIVQCQSTIAKTEWEDGIADFRNKLIHLQTPKTTVDAILSLLLQYRNREQAIIPTHDDNLNNVIRQQNQLSPSCFIEGILVLEWKRYVATFLPPKQSVDKWIRQLIQMLWDLIWRLWTKRCEVIHNKTNLNKVHESDNVELRIQTILSNPPDNLRSHEKLLFQTNYSILTTHTYRYRKLWLQRVERIIAKAQQTSQSSQYENERRVLAKWLKITPRTSNHAPQPIRYTRASSKFHQRTLNDWFHHN